MKIFSTRVIPNSGLKLMRDAGFEVDQYEGKQNLTQEALADICQQYDALLNAGPNKIDEPLLSACPNLKVISLLSVGYDNVDIEAANKYHLPIGHTPDVVSRATAEIAFLLMLCVSRKAIFMNQQIREGKWAFNQPTVNLGLEVDGKTLGIFGLGRIGQDLAQKCKAAYNMSIIYHNRHRNLSLEETLGAQYVSFDDLLKQSDVLSVHANLSKETEGIFNKNAFQKMRSNAIFINTARGAIHNETDLARALQDGNIWGAGLDVTNPEPMKKDNILLSMPNVCILPHIGTATAQTRSAMADVAAKNIIAGLRGEPLPHAINPEVYRNNGIRN